ncbi:hypothetical protein EDD18DRAFT_1098000 [Armillaria luteobubalina]|uniref:Uncharacterized protein n=1 Tax=Armillaria luteobubalina TaxID=153913 RepID=A0AA39QQU0_9AGAR|nr:hypothetical protein EDD18DRAFT_1098000 [Armillaria luteobubalina]
MNDIPSEQKQYLWNYPQEETPGGVSSMHDFMTPSTSAGTAPSAVNWNSVARSLQLPGVDDAHSFVVHAINDWRRMALVYLSPSAGREPHSLKLVLFEIGRGGVNKTITSVDGQMIGRHPNSHLQALSTLLIYTLLRCPHITAPSPAYTPQTKSNTALGDERAGKKENSSRSANTFNISSVSDESEVQKGRWYLMEVVDDKEAWRGNAPNVVCTDSGYNTSISVLFDVRTFITSVCSSLVWLSSYTEHIWSGAATSTIASPQTGHGSNDDELRVKRDSVVDKGGEDITEQRRETQA